MAGMTLINNSLSPFLFSRLTLPCAACFLTDAVTHDAKIHPSPAQSGTAGPAGY